jgi:hypothetical protein
LVFCGLHDESVTARRHALVDFLFMMSKKKWEIKNKTATTNGKLMTQREIIGAKFTFVLKACDTNY